MCLYLILSGKELIKIKITDIIIPVTILFIIVYGIYKKVDIFTEFTKGAWENIKVACEILPTLLGLILAINLLKASGALIELSKLIKPVTDFLGFPSECVPLALIRPVSGSGAIAVFEDILKSNGPDTFIGKVASVLLGSTETTFYTIAIYYGVAKIKKTRQTLIASLSADFTGFVFSALIVRLILH